MSYELFELFVTEIVLFIKVRPLIHKRQNEQEIDPHKILAV